MYKKLFLPILFFSSFVSIAVNAQNNDPYMGIVPAPVSVKKLSGDFIVNQQTVLVADSITNKAVVFLADFLQNKANLIVKPQAYTGQSVNNGIIITSAGADALPAQGYRLLITPQNVTIIGRGAGIFNGIQTLLQLMPLEYGATIKIPGAEIDDYPRFTYRGLHLDVSRHFFGVDFIKKYIDLMAMYKLNNFHWHLSDDQGWRVEIKKYPKLISVASNRAETLIGNYHDRTPQQFDNTPYGGYYTQDQVRDIVKYAADRYINVIPEIDLPGHSKAALTAYPEYGCNIASSYTVSGTWSERHDVFCPSEATFSFLQDVLNEVMDLFPGKYIHIGGDEVAKDDWQNSKLAQDVIKKNKLKDEQGLQSYFVKRMEAIVNARGRTAIGWDEVLQGGIAPNVTIMSWQGEAGGIAAARQSHDVIMVPSNMGLYLDHAQGRLGTEPVGIGSYKPLSMTYAYNPTPSVLTPGQQKYIIGVQANLWVEYIATGSKVEYMILPRALAMAEVGWTPLANKNYKDFLETRLPQ
ncbi:MAG: beta-N-acetylhexosaminidase, partial [Mucilaginibacter sp.]